MAIHVSTILHAEKKEVLRCYHVRDLKSPNHAAHTVTVEYLAGRASLRVLGWGRRDQSYPICPEHRAPTDLAW